jgi:hypothetical protein
MLRTLEALICLGILATFLVLFFSSPLKIPGIEKANYKLFVFSALKVLDKTGKLRKYALEKNVSAIETELARHLPYLIDYKVVIYNETTNITSIPEILAEEIVTVDYLLAGNVGNYSALHVQVLVYGF